MFAPIFQVCSADPVVGAIIGAGVECRLFPFGEAPQGVQRPYAVWQTVTGIPENYLNQIPNIDAYGIQVDVYSEDVGGGRALTDALAAAIEPQAHVVSWGGESRDPDTNLWRVIFSVDWWVTRS